MLCDDCILELFDLLDDEPLNLFQIIAEQDGLLRSELQEIWNEKYDRELTDYLFRDYITKLEHTKLVTHQDRKKLRFYFISEEGERLLELL